MTPYAIDLSEAVRDALASTRDLYLVTVDDMHDIVRTAQSTAPGAVADYKSMFGDDGGAQSDAAIEWALLCLYMRSLAKYVDRTNRRHMCKSHAAAYPGIAQLQLSKKAAKGYLDSRMLQLKADADKADADKDSAV